MPTPVAMIQTSWPHIRVVLYQREDGLFQYVEEGPTVDGKEQWSTYRESGLFNDFETAKSAMIDYCCNMAEDEHVVDPDSVTILEPPDFKGPHHPRLRRP